MSYDELANTRQAVNEFLDKFYLSQIERASQISTDYERLWQFMLNAHQAGGKRLRPYMVTLAYRAAGGKDAEKVLPVAAAFELLHSCLLMHDDIIDRDYVRHGKPNTAGQYREYYGTHHDSTHLADSAALLGGDLLLSATYQLILESELSTEQKIAAMDYIGKVIFTVAGGELLDTESAALDFSDAEPLSIAKFKTADYSFVAPLTLGALLAKADEKILNMLSEFGQAVGIAFQLTDDLLDIYGEPDTVGKPIGSDVTEAKRTFVMTQALKTATKPQKETLESLAGKPELSADDVLAVKAIMEETGAKKATQKLIDDYIKTAQSALQKASLKEPFASEFRNLADKVAGRKA